MLLIIYRSISGQKWSRCFLREKAEYKNYHSGVIIFRIFYVILSENLINILYINIILYNKLKDIGELKNVLEILKF